MLFLKYEDMKKDLSAASCDSICKIHWLQSCVIDKIADQTMFEKMRVNSKAGLPTDSEESQMLFSSCGIRRGWWVI